MAEEKEKNTQPPEDKKETAPAENKKGRLLQWVILIAVIGFFAVAGLGLGRLFANPKPKSDDETPQPQQTEQPLTEQTSDSENSAQTWYYDVEPVVANLDEPGVTRYIRVAITLQISSEIDTRKCTALLEQKKPLLVNHLTIYLASLSLEDIRGDKNIRRIQSQILESFNEKLFPDSKPMIKSVLFKEFAVQ